MPTKDHGDIPVPRYFFNRHQENNAIVNNAVGGILLMKKVSDTIHEAQTFLDSDYYENDLYEVEKISLEETKEKLD